MMKENSINKKAILILAHKSPYQVGRLITNLQHKDIDVYIHIDKKAYHLFNDMEEKYDLHDKVIRIINNTNVNWGGYSQIQATLNSLNEIVSNRKYNQFILLSGQDFPIKPIEFIFKEIHEKNFIEFFNLEKDLSKDWKHRYEFFYFTENKFSMFATKILRKVMKNLNVTRRLPDNNIPYGGSQWWILTDELVNYLLKRTNQKDRLVKFMRNVWIPDEFFFQTLLVNSKFSHKIINDHKRYIDWSNCNKGLSSSPNTIGIVNLTDLSQSDKYFARKFDVIEDECILDKIEEDLLQNNKAYS